jgi:hypothetical protein
MRAGDTRILTIAELEQVSGGFECRTGMEGPYKQLRDFINGVPRPPTGQSYGAGAMTSDMATSVNGAKPA